MQGNLNFSICSTSHCTVVMIMKCYEASYFYEVILKGMKANMYLVLCGMFVCNTVHMTRSKKPKWCNLNTG